MGLLEGSNAAEFHADIATSDTARAFVAARRDGSAVTAYPGTPPQDFTQAYAIQEQAIALDGRAIAGWKVGRVNPPASQQHGTDRLAGPIFDDLVRRPAPDEVAQLGIYRDGFAAAEAELLFRVDSLPAGDVHNLDDAAIMALVGAVHVGMEIASSPYARINEDGPLVTTSDFGNNAGLVIGAELTDWRSRDLTKVIASLAIDGVEQGRKDLQAFPGGPIQSVRFLLGHLAARAAASSTPVWVSTGAITGVHPISAGATAVATFDDAQVVACRVTG